MARIIALANQKGGVAKTTSTLALGAALTDRGQRVLLVDLDPQASHTARPPIRSPVPSGLASMSSPFRTR